MTDVLACTKCHGSLTSVVQADHIQTSCPSCHTVGTLHLFPAYSRSKDPTVGGEPHLPPGSVCFYHDSHPAVRICDGCGAFICDLCDLDLDSQHLCPKCLDSGQTKGKLQQLNHQFVLYDGMALALALLPFSLALWFMIFLTAPIALYLGVRYWNNCPSAVPRTKWRAVLAILISSLQLLGLAILIFYLFHLPHKKH